MSQDGYWQDEKLFNNVLRLLFYLALVYEVYKDMMQDKTNKQTNPEKIPSLYLVFQENLMSLFHPKSSTSPILCLSSNSNKIKFKKKEFEKKFLK